MAGDNDQTHHISARGELMGEMRISGGRTQAHDAPSLQLRSARESGIPAARREEVGDNKRNESYFSTALEESAAGGRPERGRRAGESVSHEVWS